MREKFENQQEITTRTVISSCVYVTTAPTDDHNMRVDGRDLLLALGIIRDPWPSSRQRRAFVYGRPCRLRPQVMEVGGLACRFQSSFAERSVISVGLVTASRFRCIY